MKPVLAFLAVTFLLAGCERSHDLELNSTSTFKVVLFQHPTVGITNTRECALTTDDGGFDEIFKWLMTNRDGWDDYIATPAVGNATISGSGFTLHIYDRSFVLAFTDRNGQPRQLIRERAPTDLDLVFDLPCSAADSQPVLPSQLTYLPTLKMVDSDSLSARSQRILNVAIDIIEAPKDRDLQLEYLSIFPSSFSDFRSVFQPPQYGELYSVYFELLEIFRFSSMQNAEVASPIFVALIRDVCFDVDAPSHFIDIWRDFQSAYPEIYAASEQQLTQDERDRLALLDSVSVHDWTPKAIMCK